MSQSSKETSAKDQLRSRLRERRQAMPKVEQQAASQAAAELALSLPQWKSTQRIALYAASDGEIDTTAIARHCFAAGVQVFLPVVGDHKKMVFTQWRSDEELVKNRYGIAEPASQAAQMPASSLDLIFMPLVAWDKKGNRLGMGGGYYDRALADQSCPVLVGLAYDMQGQEALPHDEWDIALDIVVTDREIHYCNRTTTAR